MDETLEVLYLCIYLFSIWIGGTLFSYIYAAPIGQIFAGMIFSNQVAGIIPFEDAFTLIGELGLLLIVFEGGLHTQISRLRKVGLRAFLMALTGVVLPVALACAMFVPMGYNVLAALVAGTSLASTSIGMSLQLLSQNRQLDTDLGQLVSTGAMIDDVLCLILLSVVSRFGNNGVPASKLLGIIGVPLLTSFVASIVGAFCCWIFPKIEAAVYKKLALYNELDDVAPQHETDSNFPDQETVELEVRGGESTSRSNTGFPDGEMTDLEGYNADLRDEVARRESDPKLPNQELVDLQPREEIDVSKTDAAMGNRQTREDAKAPNIQSRDPSPNFERFLIGITICMMAWGAISAYLVALAGSSNLLGAYLAGVSFCNLQFSHRAWKGHVEPLAGWMARLFFGSIGFLIPIKTMFHAKSFGYGILWTFLSILAKLACSFFTPSVKTDGLAVGWAMVARGELGFVIASTALSEGVMDDTLFVIVIWALVLTTVCAPFPFAFFLRRSIAQKNEPS